MIPHQHANYQTQYTLHYHINLPEHKLLYYISTLPNALTFESDLITTHIRSHCCTKQNRISLESTLQCSISHHQLNTTSHQTLHTSVAERYTFLTKVYHAVIKIYALMYQSAVLQKQCVTQSTNMGWQLESTPWCTAQ